MDKTIIAENLFTSGLNCAQAVVLAFKEEMGLDEDKLKKLSIAFGGGLGRQRLTCGAVSGMSMVLGTLLSDGVDKLSIYSIIQSACKEFKEQTGSIICAELLDGVTAKDTSPTPEERTTAYYKKRPCVELVKIATEITEKYLNKSGGIK
jgi:C_GCAxxG_C_C family probable redox protein